MRLALLVSVGLLPLACQASSSDTTQVASPPEAKTEKPVAAPPYDGPPKTVLVELFTSQGCNSCPAADAFVGTFAEIGWSSAQVVPLTFHVTYWDDLGWKDPYASQMFDQRQIGYAQNVPDARAKDENTIKGPYTPQMVVDGRVHFSGTLEDVAKREIESATRQPTLIELEPTAKVAEAAGAQVIVVELESKGVRGAGLDTDKSKVGLFAALTQKRVKTRVPRGENAGKELEEFSVVRAFAGPKLFRSSRPVNQTRFELAIPSDVQPDALKVVVFAQDLASLGIITSKQVDVGGPAVAEADASARPG